MSAVAEAHPLVGVIMGSKSDWDTMSQAAAILSDFGIPHEAQVVSAHRTPAWMAEYATSAVSRGLGNLPRRLYPSPPARGHRCGRMR